MPTMMNNLIARRLNLAETGDPLCPYKFAFENEEYHLRMNDFPGPRPLYTVLDSKGTEIGDLEGLPECWKKQLPPRK